MSFGAEDYDKAAITYGNNRRPVGLEIILGCLAIHGSASKISRLVDMGCGAGIYLSSLRDYFDNLVGIDISAGQIAEAKKRLEIGAPNVELLVGDARATSLEKDAYSVCLISLMLHHVRDEHGDHFSQQKLVLNEASKLVCEGGLVVIATCSPAQIERGAWYCELLPDKIIDLRKSYYPDWVEMNQEMERLGLEFVGQFVDTGSLLHGPDYSNYEKIFDPNFRKVDSVFSSLTEEDTQVFLDRVKVLVKEGKIEELIRSNSRHLEQIGQVSFRIFKKSIKSNVST